MRICAFCEAQAEHAVDGVPVCKECAGKPPRELGTLKADRQIRAALHREILASTARAHAAAEELKAIMDDIPSGLPLPDGSQRIHNAAHALAAARHEVREAHSRLDDFLARASAARDFEPGSPA